MIAIVDTGGANIASVRNALARLGATAELTCDVRAIQGASHVILPGVGAARAAMERIAALGLVEVLRGLTQPTLGICLGMQLLFQSSEEGDAVCLGLIPGKVTRLRPSVASLAVPHMGWNRLRRRAEATASPLLEGIPDGTHFYFVHSFVAPAVEAVQAQFSYGGEYPAMVQRENFFGVQFHPERSGDAGARLLGNFIQ